MRPRSSVDPKIKEYATAVQREYIDAVNEHGSVRAAARAKGVNYSSVMNCIMVAEKNAALRGYAPAHDMHHSVPAPFVVKGVSTLYNAEGQVSAQWVKSKVDDQRALEALKEFVAELVKDAKGLSKVIAPPKLVDEDLLSVYPVGDPHFGMYAWKPETGADFDTEIAERLTFAAVDRLVSSAPNAHTAVLASLGDLMHADNSKNATPQSGNVLDVDSRHKRVILIACRAMKRCIYRLLEKNKVVHVRFVDGNHDPTASFAIAMALSEHFCNNERVVIDLDPSHFWYFRFGKVLLGFTHGDKAKAKDLLGVMAYDRPEDWGQTKFRHFYHGHLHQHGTMELPGMQVEWFRTLAPADAWAAGEGYRSGRDMWRIDMHKQFGEIGRQRVDVVMLEDK
jgi:hypothetical protein